MSFIVKDTCRIQKEKINEPKKTLTAWTWEAQEKRQREDNKVFMYVALIVLASCRSNGGTKESLWGTGFSDWIETVFYDERRWFCDFLSGCDRFRSGQFPAKLFFLANVQLVCQRRLWMERKNRFAYQKDLILKYWHMRRTQPLTQSNSARKPELYIPVPLLNGCVRWGTCMYSLLFPTENKGNGIYQVRVWCVIDWFDSIECLCNPLSYLFIWLIHSSFNQIAPENPNSLCVRPTCDCDARCCINYRLYRLSTPREQWAEMLYLSLSPLSNRMVYHSAGGDTKSLLS